MTSQEIIAQMQSDQGRLNETKAKVREMFPKIDFPDITAEPIWFGRREHSRFDGKTAIVGTIKGERHGFGVASERDYKIVHHEEVLDSLLQTVVGLSDRFGEPKIRPTLLDNGARMYGDIEFPDVDKTEIAVGDTVAPKATFRNSYDLKWRYSLGWGATQLTCLNGVVSYRLMQRLSGKHRQSLDIGAILQELTEGVNNFKIQTDSWKRWAKMPITQGVLDNMWEELPFGPKYQEEILALSQTGSTDTLSSLIFNNKLTAWGLNNSLTQFVTHNIESDTVRLQHTEDIARVMNKNFG